MTTLDVGSYSHGTLRDCDIASTLADMLRAAGHDDAVLLAYLETIATYGDSADMDELSDLSEHETECLEYASETISDAMDALQEYAPPFCYVGFHEGDGSDLGVWFMHDSFEESCRDGSVLKISDSSDLESVAFADMAEVEYVAVVSDHGNVTLYRPRIALGEELLSLV
jgi:hypothetical protein